MTIEVRVPQLPESVADATLVSWHKKPGDAVARDENLVDLETDKVVLEVPSPVAGVLKEIKLADGTTVTSGQVLAVIDEGATALPGASAPAIMAHPAARRRPRPMPSSRRAGSQAEPRREARGRGEQGRPEGGRRLRPRRTRLEIGRGELPVRQGRGTGTGVQIAGNAYSEHARRARGEQRVPMTRLRARIAERMVQAQATQALLTSFNEVDLKAVNELRARYKDQFEKQHGVKLGFMSFFAKACVEALRKFPAVNASVEGNDIVYHEYFDVGVAVSTDRGLIVPVLRDADLQSFAEIEKSIANFAGRARAGTITMEELTGGTFTITNGGVFGSLLSTPIVNSPQSAILGMHKIQDRAVVIDGAVVVRPMMYIALTYDHRIIDGREAVQFLVTVKQCLEDPARMVLGV